MKCLRLIFILLLVFAKSTVIAQTATIIGIVFDVNKKPLANVNVVSNTIGTTTNSNGYYLLIVDADKEISVKFSHVGFKM